MRRSAAVMFLVAAAVTPLAADLTVTTVTTIEGAFAAATSGASPKMVVRISGAKSRMEVDTGDQTIVTISDSATNQAYLLQPKDKTATLLPAGSGGAANAAAPSTDASVRPTGQKREIDGFSCDEYLVAMKLDMSALAAGGALPPEAAGMLKDVILTVNGSVWATKDAPGAAEYGEFQKTAAHVAGAAMERAVGAAAGRSSPISGGMNRLVTGFPEALGIPYLTELTTKVEGTGQLVALMQQIGQMKITGKVASISTDPVPADVFAIPEGYTIVK
jgi:hypothetical protein